MLECGAVQAGDSVDYSAPYLTVENGELVTRYPPNTHLKDAQAGSSAGTQPAARADNPAGGAPGQQDTGFGSGVLASAIASAIALVAAITLLIRRRRRQSAIEEMLNIDH